MTECNIQNNEDESHKVEPTRPLVATTYAVAVSLFAIHSGAIVSGTMLCGVAVLGYFRLCAR